MFQIELYLTIRRQTQSAEATGFHRAVTSILSQRNSQAINALLTTGALDNYLEMATPSTPTVSITNTRTSMYPEVVYPSSDSEDEAPISQRFGRKDNDTPTNRFIRR